MKQLWYGTALLFFLFTASLFLGNHMENAWTQPIRDLDRAADAAMEGNWSLASALVTRAEKDWQHHRGITAALVHHTPLETIDRDFSQLDVFIRTEDVVQFSALCAALGKDLENLQQSGRFRWWNLL